jgi:thiol-disulfide isomerase/thioredoxin
MKRLILTIAVTFGISKFSGAQDLSIVNDYKNINSVPQLLSHVKTKILFLDLWAPWCEPCKDEFKYSGVLYKELQKRNISMLYVSLHSNVNENDWRNDIAKFNLQGVHVLATKALEDSLTKKIWGHPGGYSIPRYLLLKADGTVLIEDAIPPDQISLLLSEIDKAIKNVSDR